MAVRGYALVIMDDEDHVTDRYSLDLITEPKGNGFELELSTIQGDIEDLITFVRQKKPKITMNVLQVKDPYAQSNVLANWIQKYSRAESHMFLEYNDTNIVKYCGGKVTKLDKTERTDGGILIQPLEFTMTTPYFIKRENTITIKQSAYGKRYPYKYPYSYGSQKIENNTIDNIYLFEVPVIITLSGAIENPTVQLKNTFNEIYATVTFPQVTLHKDEETGASDQLIINSGNRTITFVHMNGEREDYRPKVDPVHEKFLFAQRGISTLVVNSGTTGVVTGSWRQYTL